MTTSFYDREYFEGKTRQSPPYTRDLIYPLADRTAAFLCRYRTPGRALDIGCAKGFLVEALHARGVIGAVGVDISFYAVSQSAPPAHGHLIVADAQSGLPVRSGSCDLVTALDLFEHLEQPLPVLREIRRVLSGSGAAYVKICHPRHPNAKRDPSHVNVQPLSYWTRLFRAARLRWRRVYEADITEGAGIADRCKAIVRRVHEWAVIGTPADYKFLLWPDAER
ncbi:MAG: class I SAM-dependent methyltransferase [Nitrospirota bacterium]